MKSIHYILLFIAVAVIAAGGSFLFQSDSTQPASSISSSASSAVPGSLVGSHRPDFALTDTEGKLRHIGDWNGKVILLNFWASWCPHCRKELPDFVRLYDHYKGKGFMVVGVGIDKRQDLQDFMDQTGVDYPVMVAQLKGVALAQKYGDHLGALPYSVVIDRDGKIVKTYLKELSYAVVEKAIKPLL